LQTTTLLTISRPAYQNPDGPEMVSDEVFFIIFFKISNNVVVSDFL